MKTQIFCWCSCCASCHSFTSSGRRAKVAEGSWQSSIIHPGIEFMRFLCFSSLSSGQKTNDIKCVRMWPKVHQSLRVTFKVLQLINETTFPLLPVSRCNCKSNIYEDAMEIVGNKCADTWYCSNTQTSLNIMWICKIWYFLTLNHTAVHGIMFVMPIDFVLLPETI